MSTTDISPLVSLRDVHLAFGDTEVLKGIDVEVKPCLLYTSPSPRD